MAAAIPVNYQYAVKTLQGKINVGGHALPIGPGIYFTSVNVHNPWREKVRYAVKTAVSGRHGVPGAVSAFTVHELDNDQATEYEAQDFLPNPPAFLESYFVIESEKELDVVGVYTGAAVQDERLGAMHLERVPVRVVPRCKDLKLNISTGIEPWQITAVPATGSTLSVGPAPIASPTHPSWATPPSGVSWLGVSYPGSTGPGKYNYRLEFCLCWTFKNPSLDCKLWADNSAIIKLHGKALAFTCLQLATSRSGTMLLTWKLPTVPEHRVIRAE
ncbi:MAG: hypothetical protein ACYDG5_07075 [Dehalococcoidales bacterium]